MTGEIDLFGEYVRSRLDGWGREFALGRDCEYLGHRSKNMLSVLIEHRGEMPPPVTGFKPLELDLAALQIEQVVADIGRDTPRIACALRGHYCGSGRRKVERYKDAMVLIAAVESGVRVPQAVIDLRNESSLRALLAERSGRVMPNLRQHLAMVDEGRAMVRGALIGLARAA